MSFPIILLNYGNPWYLKYSISQCIGTNKDARLILIGDKSNYGYAGVEHYMYEEYMSYANTMVEIYAHMNTTPPKYELFCLQRWFILYEFMKKSNLNECFIMDSDVLLYEPIGKYGNSFGNAKLTLYAINRASHAVTGGSAFVLDVEFLKIFCDYCVDVYRHKTGEDYLTLANHYQKLQQNGLPGGVCDMTLWSLFYNRYSDQIYNTQQMLPGNVYIDININSPDVPGYKLELENGRKKVSFKDGIPYARAHADSGEMVEVRLPCLHFQGEVKKHMPEFITYRGYYYWYNHHFINLKNRLRSLIGI